VLVSTCFLGQRWRCTMPGMSLPRLSVCPLCRGLIQWLDMDGVCSRCSETYPSIEDVELLVAQPFVLLQNARLEVLQGWASSEFQKADLVNAQTEADRRRITEAMLARRENQELLERVLAPAISRRTAERSSQSLLMRRSVGWSFDRMVHYFVTDWSGQRQPLWDTLRNDIVRHASERRTAIVLGSGASGLVRVGHRV